MRSLIRTTGLAAAAFVLLAAGSARAATIEVQVPFPFLVQGRSLPAGQYRVTDEAGLVQFRGEKGNTANVFFLAAPVTGHDPAGAKPARTFTRHATQYRLAEIWESGGTGLEPLKR